MTEGTPSRRGGGWRGTRALALVAASYLAGAVPSAQLLARARGVDLRVVGTGTVSGTGLGRVAGVGPLVAAGVLDVAKGSVGPAVAGRATPLAALAGGAAVVGHNGSVFLHGAGGRGLSPAMGALLVTAPTGSGVLLAGLAVGRLARQTGLGAALADLAVVPVSARFSGRQGALAAGAVLAPMVVKRLADNAAPARRDVATYAARLLFDRDTWHPVTP